MNTRLLATKPRIGPSDLDSRGSPRPANCPQGPAPWPYRRSIYLQEVQTGPRQLCRRSSAFGPAVRIPASSRERHPPRGPEMLQSPGPECHLNSSMEKSMPTVRSVLRDVSAELSRWHLAVLPAPFVSRPPCSLPAQQVGGQQQSPARPNPPLQWTNTSKPIRNRSRMASPAVFQPSSNSGPGGCTSGIGKCHHSMCRS